MLRCKSAPASREVLQPAGGAAAGRLERPGSKGQEASGRGRMELQIQAAQPSYICASRSGRVARLSSRSTCSPTLSLAPVPPSGSTPSSFSRKRRMAWLARARAAAERCCAMPRARCSVRASSASSPAPWTSPSSGSSSWSWRMDAATPAAAPTSSSTSWAAEDVEKPSASASTCGMTWLNAATVGRRASSNRAALAGIDICCCCCWEGPASRCCAAATVLPSCFSTDISSPTVSA
mmetsp:Transcript_6303/g.16525  ORF Transcript_6303/g.16525 Transcript_6303/m.16525 type:complete len:236 (-) Transcript_6303:795-1502(-)